MFDDGAAASTGCAAADAWFDAELANLAGGVRAWAGQDLSALPVVAIPRRVEILLRARNEIDGELLRELEACDRSGEAARLGGGSTAGWLSDVAGERAHLSVTVSLESLEARAGASAAQLGHTGPVVGETARRLACDASVSRVVTDGPSQIVDVGRRTSVIHPALRRALVVRDGGCVHPGCDRPPSWTEGHHRVHWADGGPTDLDNLILLCRRHHRAQHEGGRTLRPALDRPGYHDTYRRTAPTATRCATCRPLPHHQPRQHSQQQARHTAPYQPGPDDPF